MGVPGGVLGTGGTAAGLSMWDRGADHGAGDLLEQLSAWRPVWWRQGACRSAPADVTWFPEHGQPSGPAKAVCAGCPAVDECRAWSVAQGGNLHGIWGGLSPQERRRLRKG